MNASAKAVTASATAVVVRRTIAAAAEEIFDAWLDAEALAIWMRPDGKVVEHVGKYVEIDPPRRLVFTWASPATQHKDSLVTIEFIESDGATEVSLTHEQLPSEESRDRHTEGWKSVLNKLERFCRD